MWEYGGEKIVRILEALRKGIGELVREFVNLPLDEFIEIYWRLEPIDIELLCPYNSALFPVEPIKEYRLDIPSDALSIESDILLGILKERGFCVGSIDSGTFISGPHLLVNIVFVNVGYWYLNHESGSGGSGNYAEMFSYAGEGERPQLKIKDAEMVAIEKLVDKMDGKLNFLFMDESLSLAYTMSWNSEDREKMVKKICGILNSVMERGVIPLGIYYTRAADIGRGILAMKGKELPILSDRILMNRVLGDGARSPLFKVNSRALANKLRLLAFYLKVSERNVLRVEFPESMRRYVDDIHLAVLSHSVLGGGYPLALQRAHDLAVIGGREREVIIEMLKNMLNLPSDEYIYSKKWISKRCPII